MQELVLLREWLMSLDPNEHYCGWELDFGIERSEVIEYIDKRIGAIVDTEICKSVKVIE